MNVRSTFLAAAAVLALTGTTAEAARLTTPPIAVNEFVSCGIMYFGSTKNVSMNIATYKESNIPGRRIAHKMGPANRYVQLSDDCYNSPSGGNGCMVACSFTFSLPASDFSATICSTATTGNSATPEPMCFPAR